MSGVTLYAELVTVRGKTLGSLYFFWSGIERNDPVGTVSFNGTVNVSGNARWLVVYETDDAGSWKLGEYTITLDSVDNRVTKDATVTVAGDSTTTTFQCLIQQYQALPDAHRRKKDRIRALKKYVQESGLSELI